MWLVNFAKMLSFSSYDWFSSFFILSIELPKLAVTSKRRFRYKKAKQVHDLRFDSWILQNCRRSRVMASSPWRPFWTFLRTKPLIVGSLGTSTFDMYCSTAMGFVNSARKSLPDSDMPAGLSTRIRSWSRPPHTFDLVVSTFLSSASG